MKITAVNFSGTQASILTNALAPIKDCEVNSVTISSAEDEVGKEDCVIFYWEGDATMGVNYIQGMREAMMFRDIPIVLVSQNKPDFLEKAKKAGAGLHLSIPLKPEALQELISRAVKPVGKPGVGVKVEMVNPFIDSAVEVLTTMAAVKNVERRSLFLKKDYRMMGEITGVMGLTGMAVGAVAVSLNMPLAKKLVGGMLQVDASTLPPDEISDGVGELINMISGKAKSAFANTEYKFAISLPTIVAGAGHEIIHKSGTPCIVILLAADGEEFALQVSLAKGD